MVKVEFLGPINREPLEVEVANLNELKLLLSSDESLKQWLALSAVAINDEIVSNPNFVLKNGDKISILPPVCGG